MKVSNFDRAELIASCLEDAADAFGLAIYYARWNRPDMGSDYRAKANLALAEAVSWASA
jgi:hypothetical protein